jgi:hypothetical protein
MIPLSQLNNYQLKQITKIKVIVTRRFFLVISFQMEGDDLSQVCS